MLAKQFWRINHNPQSLLARALKDKYFPRCSIHDCSPKSHHSWLCRSILKLENPKLKEGSGGLGGVLTYLSHIMPSIHAQTKT